MSRAKALRRARYGQVAALTANVGTLAFNLVVSPWVALVPLACIIAIALAIWMTTRTIRRREYLDRPRPDYALIARMEREVYGETFRHEGSIASMFLPPELHPLVTPKVPSGAFETVAALRRERKESAKGPYATLRCPRGHESRFLANRPPPRTCPECDGQRVTPAQVAGTGWGSESFALRLDLVRRLTEQIKAAQDDEHRSNLRWGRRS